MKTKILMAILLPMTIYAGNYIAPGTLAVGGAYESSPCKDYWDSEYDQCLKLKNATKNCPSGYKWSNRLSKCYKKIWVKIT